MPASDSSVKYSFRIEDHTDLERIRPLDYCNKHARSRITQGLAADRALFDISGYIRSEARGF